MKKRSIHKLKLRKSSISKLNENELTGGNYTNTLLCETDFCETIDYSRCKGEYQCQIYPYPVNRTF